MQLERKLHASSTSGWLRGSAADAAAVGDRVPGWIAARLRVTAQDLVDRGSVAAVSGTPDQMCEQLVGRRERLGLSYILLSDEFMDLFAPVVQRLAGS